jgi:hypothetical protein
MYWNIIYKSYILVTPVNRNHSYTVTIVETLGPPRRGLARIGLARVLRILASPPDESSFPSTTFSLLSPTPPSLHLFQRTLPPIL